MIFISKPYLDLERRFLTSQQLFTVEGEVLFLRLEFISKHNLELFTHFESLKKTHDLIQQTLLPKAKEQLDILKAFKDKHAVQAFSVHYDSSKVTLELFISSVRKFMDELKRILQPEMDMKAKIADTKDHIRGLRVEYFKYAPQLTYLESKFTFAFEQFDNMMLTIEKWLDSGNYDDIELQLKKIKKICIKLMELMANLPPLCSLLSAILPEKMATLRKTAEDLAKQGYPIHHLLVYDTIQKIEDERQLLDAKLQSFEIIGLEPAFKNMLEKLDAFYPLFEKEKAAKIMVENDYETTYERVNRLEKNLAKLNADLPRIKTRYVLEDSRLASIEIIHQQISELNRIKRGLDTLVLSGTKQPYTLQLSKIRTLNALADEVDQRIEAFSSYVVSLKKQAMDAFQQTQALYQTYKDLESSMATINLPRLTGQHEAMFTRLYETLNHILNALQQLPINMNIVDENLRFLNEEGEPFLQQRRLDVEDAKKAEMSLLKANQERHRTSDHQRLISLAEAKFFEGKFKEVWQDMDQLFKRMPEEGTNQKHKKTR
jgi:septation ring formation regulator EzrA